MNFSDCSRLIVLGGALASLQPLTAGTLIQLQNVNHSTFVLRGELGSGAPVESRTNFTTHPVADFLVHPADPLWEECRATASIFEIATRADARMGEIFRGHSEAFSQTQFTFVPEADTFAPIRINFSLAGQFAYGGNEICLTDLTTGITLWSYYDHGFSGGNIPWDFFAGEPGGPVTASVHPEATLFAAHEYQFTMSSWGNSNTPDVDERRVEICGLDLPEVMPVPEPTTGALTLLAAAGMFLRRQKS